MLAQPIMLCELDLCISTQETNFHSLKIASENEAISEADMSSVD